MFSGLTNQVSSWMGSSGKKEGELPKSEDEKLQSPIADTDIGALTSDGDKKDASSPTKASKMEMLSNVKSQMTGWLSSGVSGLRKTDPAAEGTDVANVGEPVAEPVAPEKHPKGSTDEGKEDDNSSATGGADSDAPVSEPGTPGEDKEGAAGFAGTGAVSTKALQGAKSIGSFLYSAVNKAGKTVSEASAKIKKTVEENTLLSDFNKEQDAFIKDKQGKNSDAAVPPWVGCPNEESLKEEFLSLSTDRRNFVRSPPAGVEFDFDYEVTYPVAMATMAEDPNLEKMRFELVPKVINEENFWRNYFYRVSLIRQANELSSMEQEGGRGSGPSSRINSVEGEPAAKRGQETVSVGPTTDADSPTSEFVSDTVRASSTDIEEVRAGMRILGLDSAKRDEEEWEKELEAELQDYEVVNDGNNTSHDANFENQIQEMLDDEEMTDLK